jgi:small subunit ribosomal protein S4e
LGRKGERRHLKRKPAPKLWPIHRKEAVWTVMPNPGPHSLSRSLPLLLVVRDILGFAKTAKEAKNIISQGKILVDKKVRRDERFLVGLMDLITIVDIKDNFRVLPSKKGLYLEPIKSNEDFKLYRIDNKTFEKGNRLRLDLHDGTNFLVGEMNTQTPEANFTTLDVLKLSLPDRELLDHIKLRVGVPALVISGKNMGKYGKIISIEKRADKKRRDLLVTLKDKKDRQFQTILDFVFVLGEAESAINLPEVD